MFEHNNSPNSSSSAQLPRFFKPMLRAGIQSKLVEGDLIKVTVVGAEGLAIANKKTNSSNPYCSLRCNMFPRNTMVKYWNEDRLTVSLHTKVVKETINPKWGETFEFFIDEEQALTEVNLTIKMEVLSKNSVLLDDSLGLTNVEINPEKYTPGKDHKVQQYLSKEGYVNLLIRIDRNPQYVPKGNCYHTPTDNQL